MDLETLKPNSGKTWLQNHANPSSSGIALNLAIKKIGDFTIKFAKSAAIKNVQKDKKKSQFFFFGKTHSPL